MHAIQVSHAGSFIHIRVELTSCDRHVVPEIDMMTGSVPPSMFRKKWLFTSTKNQYEYNLNSKELLNFQSEQVMMSCSSPPSVIH